MTAAQYVIFRLQELLFGVEILKIKEVLLGARRYVVCLNPEEAVRDQEKRWARTSRILPLIRT